MMPLKIERASAAKRDLFDIWDYIEPNSQKGATRIIREFYAAFSMLAEQPKSGRERPELGEGLRSFPVESYLIFYRSNASTLSIVRVLHSARDITPEMLSD